MCVHKENTGKEQAEQFSWVQEYFSYQLCYTYNNVAKLSEQDKENVKR